MTTITKFNYMDDEEVLRQAHAECVRLDLDPYERPDKELFEELVRRLEHYLEDDT